jgi:predicted acylesterase/phospholipase RssA
MNQPTRKLRLSAWRARLLLGRMLTALVCVGCLTGCRTVERTMLGLSRIKSPITINTPGLNHALTREELLQAGIDPESRQPAGPTPTPGPGQEAGGTRFDDLSDLATERTKVFVCLSGGGARAARMAAHTMALLEQEYNAQTGPAAKGQPLVEAIDAWSTVSGGSVYASYVAASALKSDAREETFKNLANGRKVRWATQRLGAMAAVFYFWPGNMGYAPVMQLLTEWDTLNLFARTHAMFQEGRLPILPTSGLRKLGELPRRPRFLFNATCLETGRPMIFTQALLHRDLSHDPLERLAPDPLVYWAGGEQKAVRPNEQPLGFATTLEDLGSGPGRFPVAHAVFASAAFPGAFQPLLLHKFRPSTNAPPAASRKPKPLWERHGIVTIVDGGIYDNTGLTTALELAAWLEAQGKPGRGAQRFVILSVDANNETDAYKEPTAPARVPWRLDVPVRGLLPAVSTFSRLYTKQQSLVRAALARRIASLVASGSLEFYEVKLIDAVKNAADVRKIPTDFVMTDREDAALKEAVAELLGHPRGGAEAKSLAAAFVGAVRAARPPKSGN